MEEINNNVCKMEESIALTSGFIEVLHDAANAVDRELKYLNNLNRRKAIQEIAELYEVSATLLWWFVEHGEEEAERLMNLRRNGKL